jgi:hypothetical protein
MKKTVMLAGLFLLAGSAPGRAADKDYEQLTEELIATLKSTTEVLATIKDEESAKAAAPKLRKIGGELRRLLKKGQDLGPPSKKQKEELKKKYRKDMEAAQERLREQLKRVQSVAGGKAALQELKGKKESPDKKAEK